MWRGGELRGKVYPKKESALGLVPEFPEGWGIC